MSYPRGSKIAVSVRGGHFKEGHVIGNDNDVYTIQPAGNVRIFLLCEKLDGKFSVRVWTDRTMGNRSFNERKYIGIQINNVLFSLRLKYIYDYYIPSFIYNWRIFQSNGETNQTK